MSDQVCSTDPAELAALLFALWKQAERVDTRSLADPATPYVDWLDQLADQPGPGAPQMARTYLAWLQPGLNFG